MSNPSYKFGNRFTCGSTRSGKSTAAVIDIVAAALAGWITIVVIDPHAMSLAWNAFVQLASRGMRRRILFDRLSNLSRVLGYRFLRPSKTKEPLRREAENEQTIREFIDVLLRRRDMQSLASHPMIEEFIFLACQLIIYQPRTTPASDIRFAFEIHERRFHELVSECTKADVQAKFRSIASGDIKPGQYAAASRLIRSVCSSPAFTTRCHSSFDMQRFLNQRGILLVEGASHGISPDTSSTIMGAIILQVFHYIRSRRYATPRVLLVIDEATNANLIGSAGHEVRALAELQKKGLDIHILCQSPNFPSTFVEDGVLQNTIEHHWFFAANDSVAQKGARDLGDPEYRQRIRSLQRGERFIKRLNHVTFDKVSPLADLWAWPGLADKKAERALTEILKRNEYWSPSQCQPATETTPPQFAQEPQHNKPIETNESLPSQKNMFVSPDTSSLISPADRLRIVRQQGSGNQGHSEQSDT